MNNNKCENCVHYDICLDIEKSIKAIADISIKHTGCEYFKDKSLFVESPMVLGQICYVPYKYKNEVEECRVSSLTQKADGSWKIRLTHNHSVFEIRVDEIGKTVFLTKDSAEAKLK
jgi:hypothetical protein